MLGQYWVIGRFFSLELHSRTSTFWEAIVMWEKRESEREQDRLVGDGRKEREVDL